MKVLNLNAPFSADDVAQLLASKDDSQNRQLRVTVLGEAFLSDVIGSTDLHGIAFCLEIWLAGNGYTGPGAASDPAFVARIEKVLRENWPKASNTYIDAF